MCILANIYPTLVSALTAVFSDLLSMTCRTCLSYILPLITFVSVLPCAALADSAKTCYFPLLSRGAGTRWDIN